jgi:hypothetical protein
MSCKTLSLTGIIAAVLGLVAWISSCSQSSSRTITWRLLEELQHKPQGHIDVLYVGRSPQAIHDEIKSIGLPAIPILTEAMSDPRPGIRLSATIAYGNIAPASASHPHLSQLVFDPEPTVGAAALIALGQCGDPTVLTFGNKLATSPSVELRVAAIQSLGRFQSDDSESILLRYLKDPVDIVQSQAVTVLANRGSSQTSDALSHLASDSAQPDWIREQCILVLIKRPEQQRDQIVSRLSSSLSGRMKEYLQKHLEQ